MDHITDRLKNYQEAQARERALQAAYDDLQLQVRASEASLRAAHEETQKAKADLQQAIDQDAAAPAPFPA